MDIIKIIGIALIGTIIMNLLKNTKSELAIFVTIATGIIILILVFNSLTEVVSVFNTIVDKTGLDTSIFSCVLKIIGVGYITEYSANICNDSGAGSIADKVILAGKISIFLMSLPIINSMVTLIIGIIQ